MPKLTNYLYLSYGPAIIRAYHTCPFPNLCISRLALLRLVPLMFGEECALWNSSSRTVHHLLFLIPTYFFSAVLSRTYSVYTPSHSSTWM